MNYILHILVIAGIYVALGSGLNLIAGYAGRLSLCSAAFFGVGAYTTAILTLKQGWPWAAGLVAGILLAALLALPVAVATLRFRGDYFAIVTFALQMIVYSVMLNWTEVTQGALGVPGIPPASILGWTASSRLAYFLLSAILAATSLLVVRQLACSALGRALCCIREDEAFALSLGKNVPKLKVLAFLVGAVISAAAGSVYASYISYIDPGYFTVHESVFILAIIIVGGVGNVWGPLPGAAVLVGVPEVLRFLGAPSNIAANLQQILFGLLLVVFVIWRPRGLIGKSSVLSNI